MQAELFYALVLLASPLLAVLLSLASISPTSPLLSFLTLALHFAVDPLGCALAAVYPLPAIAMRRLRAPAHVAALVYITLATVLRVATSLHPVTNAVVLVQTLRNASVVACGGHVSPAALWRYALAFFGAFTGPLIHPSLYFNYTPHTPPPHALLSRAKLFVPLLFGFAALDALVPLPLLTHVDSFLTRPLPDRLVIVAAIALKVHPPHRTLLKHNKLIFLHPSTPSALSFFIFLSRRAAGGLKSRGSSPRPRFCSRASTRRRFETSTFAASNSRRRGAR
jgi:hypothetical protein